MVLLDNSRRTYTRNRNYIETNENHAMTMNVQSSADDFSENNSKQEKLLRASNFSF